MQNKKQKKNKALGIFFGILGGACLFFVLALPNNAQVPKVTPLYPEVTKEKKIQVVVPGGELVKVTKTPTVSPTAKKTSVSQSATDPLTGGAITAADLNSALPVLLSAFLGLFLISIILVSTKKRK